MICAPAAARPSFRKGAWFGMSERCRDGDDHAFEGKLGVFASLSRVGITAEKFVAFDYIDPSSLTPARASLK